MGSKGGVVERLRQPEYTGENRCIPCTVVNALIAIGASLAIVGFGIALGALIPFTVGALLAFLAALVLIYLRGYLVPGTPTLTKRYFPASVLALFGKEPQIPAAASSADGSTLDPEQTLVEIGALEECEDEADLCLTEPFRTDWRDELDTIDSDAGREDLLALLDIEEGEVTYDEYGRAFVARIDGRRIGKWESEGAFLADLAAARTFDGQYPGWDQFSVEERGALLNGLRIFLDTCPTCGGTPTFGADTVESCCASVEVAEVTCETCETRLFEAQIEA
jgi:hypothetical protein